MMSLGFLIMQILLPAISGLTVSDFISKSSDCASYYSCKVSSSAFEDTAPKCKCDDECITYGECCYDAQNYNRIKQIQNVKKQMCIHGSFMLTTCPEKWDNSYVRSMCTSHSPLNIADSADPILHIPVFSKSTNFTYSNYYCALCHSDVENIVIWESKMQCFFPSDNKTLDENTDLLQKKLNLQNNRTSFNLREDPINNRSINQADDDKLLHFIKSNIKFHDERKKWLIMDSNDKNILMECHFEIAYNKVRPSSQCSPSINNCAANWTDKAVEDICLSLSAHVDYYSSYDIVRNDSGIIFAEAHVEPITYRNIYCAECNYNRIESPCILFHQDVTRENYFPVPPLNILLNIPIDIQRKNLHVNAKCKDNEIFEPFCTPTDSLLCLVTSEQYIDGVCIAKNNCNNTETAIHRELCDEFQIWNENFLIKTHHKMALLEDLERSHRYITQNEAIFGYNQNSCSSQLDNTPVRRECMSDFNNYLLSIISLVCLSLSIISITFHLIAFLLVKSLRNLPGMNLATLCCFLLLGYIAFITSAALEPKTTPCYLVASAIYFFFIGSFCWMNIIAFDTWMSFRGGAASVRLLESSKLYRRYSLVSWSFSIIALASLVAVDKLNSPRIPNYLLPKLGEHWCWFGQKFSLLLFFVVPMMASIIFTLIFFIRTSLIISQEQQEINRILGWQRDRALFKACRRLAISMGLTWVTALVAGFVKNTFAWFIFILCNGLQGVLIFGTFTCREKVWNEIVRTFGGGNAGQDIMKNKRRRRRDQCMSAHQRTRMELLHVSTFFDSANPPSRVSGVYRTQAV